MARGLFVAAHGLLSSCGVRALERAGSVAAAHGLSSCGTGSRAHRLSSCDVWA